MEERIEEFNALMEVVQTEAEDLFLDTASTMRGVRAGARSIGSPRAEADMTDEVDSGTGDSEAQESEETRAVAAEDA